VLRFPAWKKRATDISAFAGCDDRRRAYDGCSCAGVAGCGRLDRSLGDIPSEASVALRILSFPAGALSASHFPGHQYGFGGVLDCRDVFCCLSRTRKQQPADGSFLAIPTDGAWLHGYVVAHDRRCHCLCDQSRSGRNGQNIRFLADGCGAFSRLGPTVARCNSISEADRVGRAALRIRSGGGARVDLEVEASRPVAQDVTRVDRPLFGSHPAPPKIV
jgi:hypothetical protein